MSSPHHVQFSKSEAVPRGRPLDHANAAMETWKRFARHASLATAAAGSPAAVTNKAEARTAVNPGLSCRLAKSGLFGCGPQGPPDAGGALRTDVRVGASGWCAASVAEPLAHALERRQGAVEVLVLVRRHHARA